MQSAANRKVQFSHTSKNTVFCFNGPGYGGRRGGIFGPCGQIWVIGQNGRFVGPDMLFYAESGSNTSIPCMIFSESIILLENDEVFGLEEM